jgi:hypothetical protein
MAMLAPFMQHVVDVHVGREINFTFAEMTPAMPRHALEKQVASQFRLTPPDLGVGC